MKMCYFCSKKPGIGNKVSHSQHKTKRKFGANLQKIKILNKKRLICTRCIKKGLPQIYTQKTKKSVS